MSTALYLAATEFIDHQAPEVRHLASQLAGGETDQTAVSKRCFEWVRDEIKHSADHAMNPVTCSASEVLAARTGYCYAKSHLLAALLRANGIPAGLCYQRLSIDGAGPPYCLHGLNAVLLPTIGWYRIDPRGNRPDLHAEFTPPIERLAFTIQAEGEYDLPDICAEPLPQVVDVLRRSVSWSEVLANLPDVSDAR